MACSQEAKFYEKVMLKKNSDSKSLIMTKIEYYNLIEELRVAASAKNKSNRQYYILGRYEVLQCGGVEKLIKKRKDETQELVYFVHVEDLFETIKRAHIATGHGGRDKMVKELSRYANVTRDTVELFKSLCVQCQKKRKRCATKGVTVKPILSNDYGSRAQVDLVDMQSCAKGKYKWIMVYQDHLTKYCILRPLTSKRAAEVAFQLMDVFLMFGAPQILQSDNGSEFTALVISELKLLWPDLLIVHGKPRHPQSQGSVERLNCDIKDMLISWLGDNDTSDWPMGLRFVQFQKNTSYHSGIKQSPYKALFGVEARVGLRSTALPEEVLKTMITEEDLLGAYSFPSDSPRPDESPDSPECSAPPNDSPKDFAQPDGSSEASNSHRPDESPDSPECSAPRNVIGVILDRNENDMYRIGVRDGILKGRYSRSQFDICSQQLYSIGEVSADKEIGLRQAVQQSSRFGGQGYAKCNCTVGKKQCQTNRCKCYKEGYKCNSRCHSSLTCKNKN
ncbi:KRAB-A domain-containing protein 2-like [Scylla paramamosain]|uniref:KRAB-A domain-containing protein 2-like n=1 Tax=Scylla paramamosain TaxID=85552 RepID=UPI0030830CA2